MNNGCRFPSKESSLDLKSLKQLKEMNEKECEAILSFYVLIDHT